MKQDTVNNLLASFQQAQTNAVTDVLGQAYDAGSSDQKSSDGTFTQADIDSAVAAAQGVDAQALAAAQAKAQSDLAAVQSQLDGMTSKEASDESVISSLQAAVGQAQASLAAVVALFPVPPAPAPAPQS